MQAERALFLQIVARIDPQRLVYVDESGVVLGMRRAYGYAPRGQPCIDSAPYRKGRRTSLLGWISRRGGHVVACEGTVDRAVFERFVVEDLAPSLQAGDVVVWDNHSIHKGAAARAAIEARGAVLLFQPRYSPDTNAIEMLWSKLKTLGRRARADTTAALHVATEQACAAVSEQDLRGWIGHVLRLTPDQ